MNLNDPEQCPIVLDILWNRSMTGFALVGEDGRFLRANPAFCRLTEYTEWELQHKKIQDITDPSDVEADVKMAKLVSSGELEGYDMHKSYITKSKDFLPILLRVTGLRMNDKFIYFVAEIAPLERRESPTTTKLRTRNSLSLIKEYWIQITALFAVIGAFLDKLLGHYWK